MKRTMNILILICVGGIIIFGWIVIPGKLLDKQRQEVFCSKIAVSIENVHPYGEEYSILQNKLHKAIECKTKAMYTRTNADTLPEYADVTGSLLTGCREFFNSWLGLEEDFLEGNIEPENLYLCLQEGECNLAIFSYPSYGKKQNIYVPNMLYIETTSGIPVSGSIFLDMNRLGITVTDLWSGLVDTYSENLGIPIYRISVDEKPIKQNSMEVYDAKSSAKEKVIDVNQVLYAESADGSYRIQGSVYWFSNDELILDFELSVR